MLQFNSKWTLDTNSPTQKQYISSVIWSPNKPNHNNIIILHPTTTVLFHCYTQHICQSHPNTADINCCNSTNCHQLNLCVWTQI